MNSTRPDRMLRILAVCGIVGPLTYAIVLTVLGVLWSGYNPVHQYMSELGAVDAPHAFVMNFLGFQLLGISMVALGLGLYIRVMCLSLPARLASIAKASANGMVGM